MTAKKKPTKEQRLLELVGLLEQQNEVDFHIQDLEYHRAFLSNEIKELKKELKIK